MAPLLLIILQLISLATILSGLGVLVSTFNNFYAGKGFSILFSYLAIVSYNIIELSILIQPYSENLIYISRISAATLGLGLYLIHYFHDELSAIYRERRSMTIGSILFGLVISGAWFDGAINIDRDTSAPYVHPLFGFVILLQGIFAIHRITTHIVNVSELSDHYNIQSTIPKTIRNLIRRILLMIFVISSLLIFFVKDVISLPFAMMTSIGFLGLAILYKYDPISSIPITQPLKAIAQINHNQLVFLHIFSSENENLMTRDDFATLLTDLSRLFGDITKTDSLIKAMTAGNAHLMFEQCGEDTLILLLERQAPLVRRILQNLSSIMEREEIKSQREFSEIAERYLLYS